MNTILQIGDVVEPKPETVNAIPMLKAMVKRSGTVGEVVDIIDDNEPCPIHVRFGHEWFFFEADELELVRK